MPMWSICALGNGILRAVFGMNTISPMNFRISDHCNLGLFYFPETFRHIHTYIYIHALCMDILIVIWVII